MSPILTFKLSDLSEFVDFNWLLSVSLVIIHSFFLSHFLLN